LVAADRFDARLARYRRLKGDPQVPAIWQGMPDLHIVGIESGYNMPACIQVQMLELAANEAARKRPGHWILLLIQALQKCAGKMNRRRCAERGGFIFTSWRWADYRFVATLSASITLCPVKPLVPPAREDHPKVIRPPRRACDDLARSDDQHDGIRCPSGLSVESPTRSAKELRR